MPPKFTAALVALVLACAPAQSFAKKPKILAPGALVLAGTPVQCGSAHTVVTPIDDIAMTYPGYIVLDPRLFAMPDAIQHFWYAHECAHQLYGYDEKAADCWAIQTGKRFGWFGLADFEWMDANFIHLRGGAQHPPGPQRLANLKGCYAKATPRPEPPRHANIGAGTLCSPGGRRRRRAA